MDRLLALLLLVTASLQGKPSSLERYVEAWKLVGQRKNAEAIEQLKLLIADDPKFFRSYGLLVEAYEQTQALDEAELYFQELVRNRPEGGAFYALGKLNLFNGDFQSAARYFRQCAQAKIAKCAPFFVETLFRTRRGNVNSTEIDAVYRADDPQRCLAYFLYYRMTQKIRRAVETAQACLVAAEADGNDEVRLELLVHRGSLYHLTGEGYEEALLYGARAADIALRIGDPQDLLFVKCGTAYPLSRLGRDSEADELLDDCLQRAREFRHRRWANEILKRIASLAAQRGDHYRAIDYYAAARSIEAEDGEVYTAANTGRQLGEAYRSAGLLGKAKEQFKASLADFQRRNTVPWRSEQAWSLQSLSKVHEELGEYFEAIRCGTEAIKIHRELGMQWQAGMAAGDLAGLYETLGDHDAAIRYARLSLQNSIGRSDRALEQTALARIGNLYIKAGRPERALLPLQRALTLNDRTKLAWRDVSTLLSLGYAFRELNRLPEAIEKLRTALERAGALGLSEQEAEAHYRLGECYVSVQKPVLARQHLRSALTIAQRRGNIRIPPRALWQLARLERKGGNLQEALVLAASATESIESHRDDVPTPELRTSYLGQSSAIYEEAILILSLLNGRESKVEHAGEALLYAERSRARSLLDFVEEPRFRVLERLSSSEQRVRIKLESAWSRAVTENERTPSSKNRIAAETAEQELAAWWTRVRMENRSSGRHPSRTIDLAELTSIASGDPDLAILEYALGERQSHLWVITASGIQGLRLPARATIESLVRAFRDSIKVHPTAETATSFRSGAAALYNALIRPARRAVEGKRRLVVIPDGALHYLPFESLVELPDTGRFLIEDHSISYAPSLSVLAALRKRPPSAASRDLLAYGDPDYGAPIAGTAPANLVRNIYQKAGFHFLRLPSTRKEVEMIARLFPSASREVRIGSNATEGSIKAAQLNDFRRLHFAVHGMLDEQVPGRSSLILALSPASGTEDGVLRVGEIASLHLDAELVTLSACQTGLGTYAKGEGVLGMKNAFLHAGARRVLVSLWEVNDIALPPFMERFYRMSLNGMVMAEALREAKLAMIHSKTLAYRHPYFWAPFVLNGLR